MTNPSRPARVRLVPLDPWELEYIRLGLAPDVLWEHAEWRAFYGSNPAQHAELVAHLRESARLPR